MQVLEFRSLAIQMNPLPIEFRGLVRVAIDYWAHEGQPNYTVTFYTPGSQHFSGFAPCPQKAILGAIAKFIQFLAEGGKLEMFSAAQATVNVSSELMDLPF